MLGDLNEGSVPVLGRAIVVTRTTHSTSLFLRKEVIQPQVPLRLPCYDLVPITELAFGAALLSVGLATSGALSSRGLTGGVYKAQEHIHRGVADPRLLAIPTSWRRVAASNPNWGRLSRFPPPCGLGSLYARHCSTCVALGIKAMRT